MDCSIIVATYGDPGWQRLANERAIPNAETFGVPVIPVHGPSLHEARNEGARQANTEWLVFLDADDELEPHYIERLARGTADLRAPAVRYVKDDRMRSPRVPRVAGHTHPCTGDCLVDGNWLVIGTAIRADLFTGFRDWPCYEDWDLFLRMWIAGATVEAIPGAVYRAYVRPESRNRGALTPQAKHAVHQAIAAANKVPVPA